MKITYCKALGLCTLLLLTTYACRLDEFQDVEGISFETEFALPLVNASVSIQDLLDRSSTDLSFLTIEDDGSFTLSYQGEADVLNGVDALDLLQASFPIPVPDQMTTVPLSSVGEIKIKSADITSGSLRFELRSSLPEDLDVSITFPEITKDGLPLVFNATLDYQGSTPTEVQTATIDLTGYTLHTTNGDLVIQYEALNSSNQSRDVDIVLGTAENWAFDNIEGDWGQQEFSTYPDTLEIDLYNNLVEGELYFADPKLNITIENSFGVPALVKIINAKVLTSDDQVITLSGGPMSEGFYVSAPPIGQQGESQISTFILDRNNSNIDVVFNSKPKKIWYEVEIIVAPGSNLTEGFVLQSSEINVMVTFELPIYGTAKGFATEQIIAIDLGDEDGDILKEAQLKLITANEIPIDVNLQLYFLDAGGQKVDSVFSAVTEVVRSNSPEITTFFDLTPSRMANIRSSKNILIRSEFSTSNGGNTAVRIFKNQEMSVRMGMRATLVQ